MKNVLQLKQIIRTLREYFVPVYTYCEYCTSFRLSFPSRTTGINKILLHVSLASSKRRKQRDQDASRWTRYSFIHSRPILIDFRFRVSGRCAGGRVRERTA